MAKKQAKSEAVKAERHVIEDVLSAEVEEPVVQGEFSEQVVASTDPTPEEARAMFEANASLAEVLTTEGVLKRSGVFANKTLGLDGVYR